MFKEHNKMVFETEHKGNKRQSCFSIPTSKIIPKVQTIGNTKLEYPDSQKTKDSKILERQISSRT